MKVSVPTGKYVVAVSGGVDSGVLLHALVQQQDIEVVVAHFDHGIRPDSTADAAFVHEQTEQYRLPFITERAELGPHASEATARTARYNFLRQAQKQHGAAAIITAHHQDDVLETVILNLLRGTGRLGLTSLRSTDELQRPLLGTPKADILQYAAQHKLSWREDSTNNDEQYTRNYVRHRLLVNLNADARQRLLTLIERQHATNAELDAGLSELLATSTTQLPRRWFAALPHDVAKEVLATWLRQHSLGDFDRRTLERLTIQAKTKATGKRLDVLHGKQLQLSRESISIA